jgi:chromatin structure-remodeling complex protein RSC7
MGAKWSLVRIPDLLPGGTLTNNWIPFEIDGRWVTDDYFEDKVIEEITPLGIKPGDPVGELPDPNATSHSNELSALAAASAANANKERAGGGSGGVYRAGGPTTLFGASGWGPYSDGPLNAVRKSLLSRDGVGEENWMYMMAARVAEAGEEWTKWRKEGMKAGGGSGAEEIMSSMMGSPLPRVIGDTSKRRTMEEDVEDNKEDFRGSADAVEPNAKRRKVNFEDDEPPVGVYEPHSGLVLC